MEMVVFWTLNCYCRLLHEKLNRTFVKYLHVLEKKSLELNTTNFKIHYIMIRFFTYNSPWGLIFLYTHTPAWNFTCPEDWDLGQGTVLQHPGGNYWCFICVLWIGFNICLLFKVISLIFYFWDYALIPKVITCRYFVLYISLVSTRNYFIKFKISSSRLPCLYISFLGSVFH